MLHLSKCYSIHHPKSDWLVITFMIGFKSGGLFSQDTTQINGFSQDESQYKPK